MKPATCNNRGFSIVEVLVASAILSITVVAVVAMIRTGTDVQVSVKHRQAARMIINSRLERKYGFGKFNTIIAGTTVEPGLIIDARFGGAPLTGVLTTTIANNTVIAPVPVKIVTLSLTWNETATEAETVTMTRWITE